jgi:solute:Na+ symporter, SSS family
VYLIVTLGIGFYFSRRSDKDSTNYFLAGKDIGWFAVGISIFATNISSEHFIGLAGSGAERGLAVGQFELMAIFILFFLAWFIAPIYIKSGVTTVPEFLGKRFDDKSRKFFTYLSIIIYIFTKISVTLFAGGILFYKIFGLNIYSSAIVIVLITGLYSLVGGANSVMKTIVFQGIVLITGAVLLSVFGLIEVGGFSGLQEKLPAHYFNMFKGMSDPDYPWTGIIFGAPIVAFWYWCTDQYIVQRLLSAKSIDDARRGSLFAAFLKITPIFILVLPGLVAAAVFHDVKLDEAYPLLLLSSFVPTGVKGLVLAGLLAAIMSSLASVFNVTAALFTNDIYKPRHPESSERELVLIGRLSTTVIIFLAIICVPLVKIIDKEVYLYLQSVQAFISPPIAAIFIFGLLSKRVTAKAALWTLIIGEGLGLSRLVMEMLYNSEIITSSIVQQIISINFLHLAVILFLISSVVLWSISLLQRTADTKDISEYTFNLNIKWQRIFNSPGELSKNYRTNILLSAFIVVIIIGLWSLWY